MIAAVRTAMGNRLCQIDRTGLETAVEWDLDRGPVLFGRDVRGPNSIRFPEDAQTVSKHHAEIKKGWLGYILRDLGSANGTMVNGRKVRRKRLRHGDTIEIGGGRFRVEFDRGKRSAEIKVIRGPRELKGKIWSLDEGDLWIGREIPGGRRGVVVPDRESSVSSQHAVFRKGPGYYAVQDLKSTNGVVVNGHRIIRTIRLDDADRVEMGRVVFRIRIREEQPLAR